MVKGKAIAMLVVSVAMGAGALWLANNWLKNQYGTSTTSEEQVAQVVVAAQMIPLGTQVEAKHIKLSSVPSDLAPKTSFGKLEDVVGQVAKVDIYTDDVMRAERLSKPGEGSVFASLITPEKRAVTIRVNDVVGVAGFLLPGNFVDVISSVEVDRQSKIVRTTTVLENIKVLAVDQTARTDDNKPVIVRAVTLEVTPKEAEKLMTETNRGSIQLALRNPKDVTPSMTPEPMVASKPVPVRRPVVRARTVRPSGATVTVIRGTDTSQTKVRM